MSGDGELEGRGGLRAGADVLQGSGIDDSPRDGLRNDILQRRRGRRGSAPRKANMYRVKGARQPKPRTWGDDITYADPSSEAGSLDSFERVVARSVVNISPFRTKMLRGRSIFKKYWVITYKTGEVEENFTSPFKPSPNAKSLPNFQRTGLPVYPLLDNAPESLMFFHGFPALPV